MRILLAEDDIILGEAVEYALKYHKHVVDWFSDGTKVLQASLTESYDAIVLDIGLPRLSGFEILQQHRQAGLNTPVLILTAMDAVNDRIKGLDLGADDYLIKPFDMDELMARLRAISRRSKGRSVEVIRHGKLNIYPQEFNVNIDDTTIELPKLEFLLLQKLLENAGRVFSQAELEDYLYSFSADVESNTIQVYIHNLRKKLGKELIRTIRGIGYIIDEVKD